MGEKYKSPSLDWNSAGDLHKPFQIFKQKCELIFAGPLAAKNEDYKVRMLLLWGDDKALEIYNTATWTADADKLRLAPVWEKLSKSTTNYMSQCAAPVRRKTTSWIVSCHSLESTGPGCLLLLLGFVLVALLTGGLVPVT